MGSGVGGGWVSGEPPSFEGEPCGMAGPGAGPEPTSSGVFSMMRLPDASRSPHAVINTGAVKIARLNSKVVNRFISVILKWFV